MRRAYRKWEPYLAAEPDAARGPSIARAYRVLLSPYDPDEEIGRVVLSDVTAVIEAVRKGTAKGAAPAGRRQLVIPDPKLPKYLAGASGARIAVLGSKFVVEWGG